MERIDELKAEIETCQGQLKDLTKNISLLKNENLSETDQKIIESQMIEQLNQKRLDEQEHLRWLKEREEKYQSVARKKSIGTPKMPSRKEDQQQQQQTTPIKSTLTGNRSQEDGGQQQTNASNEDPIQAKAIKQESIAAVQETVAEQPLSIRTTRERSKEQEKMQVVVVGEERQQADKATVADKSVASIELAKSDRQPTAKEREKTDSVAKATQLPAKMEVDGVEKSGGREDERSVEIKENSEGREEPAAAERGREESIGSNKRKRTSTSSNVVQQPPQQQQQLQQPPVQQTPLAAQTRRSGRISKPLRPSLTLSAPTTPKHQPDSLEQQAKRTQIDESNIIVAGGLPAGANASQLLLNDDSTKDSTTSDVTDTYTSPNSPASSILLSAENADPEQLREQKEFKSWRRSIYLLLKQAQTHKFSSLFLSPVTDDEAKGYSTVVYRPIDLTIIRKKIDSGQIKSTAEFQRDIMLMFQNAIMYNSVKHEVHQMTLEMQKEILESIDDFVNEQKAVKEQQLVTLAATPKSERESALSSAVSSSSRRKSRTLS